MDIIKENPPRETSRRANQYVRPKLTKPRPFPQEPIRWQAYRECRQRFQEDPTPANRLILEIVGADWKASYQREHCT